MSRILVLTGLAVLLASVALSGLLAGQFNREVNIGDKATVWSDLPGTDGKSYGLSSFADAKAVVVTFTCNNCPVAVAYEDRLIELARDYQGQGRCRRRH